MKKSGFVLIITIVISISIYIHIRHKTQRRMIYMRSICDQFDTFRPTGAGTIKKEELEDGNIYMKYYQDKQLRYEGKFNKYGQQYGIHKEYYPDGQIKQLVTYKHIIDNPSLCNVRDGLFQEFDENGNLKKEEDYDDGVLKAEN